MLTKHNKEVTSLRRELGRSKVDAEFDVRNVQEKVALEESHKEKDRNLLTENMEDDIKHWKNKALNAEQKYEADMKLAKNTETELEAESAFFLARSKKLEEEVKELRKKLRMQIDEATIIVENDEIALQPNFQDASVLSHVK